LGRQHIKLGPQNEMWFDTTRQKNLKRSPSKLEIPVLPVLKKIIDATATGHLTFLVTEFGKPFSGKGFGSKFKAWCKQAGLPQCACHGLRKAGATLAAENGATESQLMAMFGWKDPQMATLYTKAANRKKLAGDATKYIVVPPQIDGGTISTEDADKSKPSDAGWRPQGESNPCFSLERAAS
jgi:integrase